MVAIKIFQKNDKNMVKSARKTISINPKYLENIGHGRRNYQSLESGKNKSSDIGNKSGIYYDLSYKQKKTVERIIVFLEKEYLL